MEKQLISRIFIKRLVEAEMKKCPHCGAAQTPEIYWYPEKDGCNWGVDVFARSIADAEACDAFIQQAVAPLRAKYNLLETSN